MEHGDFDAKGADKGHVVLDDDDAAGAVDFNEQFGRLFGLGVGHAGDGFVDEEELRVLGEQHADFEPLLLAVAEVAGAAMVVVVQAGGLEDAFDAGAFGSGLAGAQGEPRAAVVGERQ